MRLLIGCCVGHGPQTEPRNGGGRDCEGAGGVKLRLWFCARCTSSACGIFETCLCGNEGGTHWGPLLSPPINNYFATKY